jgi:hypothetical protein
MTLISKQCIGEIPTIAKGGSSGTQKEKPSVKKEEIKPLPFGLPGTNAWTHAQK